MKAVFNATCRQHRRVLLGRGMLKKLQKEKNWDRAKVSGGRQTCSTSRDEDAGWRRKNQRNLWRQRENGGNENGRSGACCNRKQHQLSLANERRSGQKAMAWRKYKAAMVESWLK